jgi:HlyD family secretion protein
MKRADAQYLGAVFVFLFLSTVFFGCGNPADKLVSAKETAAIPVRIIKVPLQDLDKVLEYVGNIKAKDEALVYPKVGGKIIEKVKEEGDTVKKGEAIVYIDRDQVGLKFEKAPVESPLSGTVGRILVDIGSQVFAQTLLTSETSQTPVALVVDMDTMKINISLPEKYIPKIKLGQEAKIIVDAYPDEEFLGKISMISPVLDTDTRSASIEITAENKEHRLKSGMFAKVRLSLEKRLSIPVIPQESLMGKGDETYVYVVENNKAVLTKVKADIQQGPYVGIKDGLKGGEMVVILGQQRLSDGAAVRVEEVQ